MQAAQAHPSLIHHNHPHTERFFSWEDAFLMMALLALAWVLKPLFSRGKKPHGLERHSRR